MISHWQTRLPRNLSDLAPLLQLPSLQRFNGSNMSCDSKLQLSSPSAVKRINLDNSLFYPDGLRALLLACPHVDTLSFHGTDDVVGRYEIEYHRIGDALRCAGAKLKNLTLCDDGGPMWMDSTIP